MPSLPTSFPSVMPSVITLDITDGYIPSVMFLRETFFWRARIRRWVVFLFVTELATEMGFTDDCYTDGRDPSVTPSVLLLPTECIDVTDGISPSAKLYNVVVFLSYVCFFLLFCFLSLLLFLSFSLFFPLYSGFVAVLMTLINKIFFGIFEMFA
jgi:hypothetical protein